MNSEIIGGDEGESVQPEAPCRAEMRQRQAADHRADHARQVELDGIQRDGVGQILAVDQRRDQRLVSRSAERLRQAGDEGERQDVPDLNPCRSRSGR